MDQQTVVLTPTSNLDASKEFYSKLRFKMLSPNEPTLFTDGKVVIEVNPDRYARAGLKIYSKALTDKLDEIRFSTMVVDLGDEYLLSDPNGVKVYLVSRPLSVSFHSKDESFGIPGKYVGLSIEAHDTKKTVKFWNIMGFKHVNGNLEKGWASYSNGGMNITIINSRMCPHLFFNPGLTYFNSGNNLKVIEEIRAAEIRISEEITFFSDEGIVDNIIIQDPGGFGFFVFND